MTKIVLLGATGGCVDVLNVIQDANDTGSDYQVLGFLDDKEELWGTKVLGVQVLGGFDKVHEIPLDCLFVTGIGSPYNHWRRDQIINQLGLPRERFATIYHPTASVSRHATLGHGVVLYQYSVVGPDVHIGDHVLLLPQSVVNHGCNVGDFTIITSGVVVSGDVSIGRACYVGSQASVRQNVVIGDCAMIGMGAVVIQNVDAYTSVVGNPACYLRSNGSPESQ